jgi:hypothetical protein
MRVLIFETNLMWSSRLVQSVKALGHEALLRRSMPIEAEGADAAIVNLGEGPIDAAALIAKLKELGVPVIAHAGHKEKSLHELGQTAGVDVLATNSQLTFKLAELLQQAKLPDR